MERRKFLKKASILGLGLGLSPISCKISANQSTEVLILGAGLAGLYTALLLEEQGVSCKILEASSRVGGRVFTKYKLPHHPELGAVEIGDGYHRLMALVEKLSLKLIPGSPFDKGVFVHINGSTGTAEDWANHPKNPLAKELKEIAPYFLEGTSLRGMVPYKTISDWYKKDYWYLDFSFKEYLLQNNFDEAAIQLINNAGNYNDVKEISTAQIMRSNAFRRLGGSKKTLKIKDGNSQLPLAMHRNSSSEILTNKIVTAIEEDKQGAKVTCQNGQCYKAKKVICTLPFSTLRKIKMVVGGMSSIQQKAIKELAYTKITQVIIKPKNKFWEEDQLPTTMWTDSPLERIFSIKNNEGEIVQFKAFINGKGAEKIDLLDKNDLHQMALNTLEKIRPSTKNNIEIIDSFSWGNNPFSKGAYAEFQAGQVKEFVPALAKATPRIHFAGEHTSFAEKGMEGALASAERVVSELISK